MAIVIEGTWAAWGHPESLLHFLDHSSQRSSDLETAWRIHAGLGEWTSKVDAKASFALALESAGVATVIALSDEKNI